MTIRITGDGPKITATGSGSTVLVEISTGQHDPGSFSGVHNDLTGRSTTGAHVGTAVSIDPTGFAGNLDGTITNAQLLAAAVDDLTTGGGGGGVALGETSTTAYRGDRGKTAYDHSQVVSGNPHGTTAADVGADPAGTAAGLVDDLSGVSNQATARTNLGLGTAATAATGDFAAASHTHTGTQVTVDASGFNGNLTTSDDTVQEIAQKLDDLVIPAAGIADPGGADDDFLQRKSSAWTYRTLAQVKTDLGVIEKLPRTSGEYYTLGGAESSSSTAGSGAAGKMVAHPVWLPAGSYDRACVRTTVAAVATYRIGVYPNDAATMRPDGTTLILDCGTINMNATAGLLSATVTLSIPTSGIYWLAILMDSYTAAPTVFGWNGNTGVTPNLPYLGHRSISAVGGRGTWGALKTGVTTGSMPGTFPTSTVTDIMPQILVRAT